MKHLSEHTIEMYVLKQTIFDAPTQTAIEEHLKICPACAEIELELRGFYDELHTTLQTASNHVRAFAEKVSEPANVIRLHPYKHLPATGLLDNRYVTVLAAHSPEVFPYRFKPLAVYTSADEQIVVRILLDTEADVYKLYVLGGQLDRCRFAVVSFPELQMDVGTDQTGKAEFAIPGDKRPSNWHALSAFVRLHPHSMTPQDHRNAHSP